MERNWKRRNYFIKRELQGQYIFTFFILVLFGCLLFTGIFSLLSANTISITYKDSTLQLGKTPIILLKEILKAQWIFIIIGGVSVVIISLFLTHRFAGPLFRFEKSLEAMIGGDHSFVITLRSRDEAKELAEMINRYNSRMSENIREMRTTADNIQMNLVKVSGSIDLKESGDELAVALDLTGRLKEKLHFYKLKNDI